MRWTRQWRRRLRVVAVSALLVTSSLAFADSINLNFGSVASGTLSWSGSNVQETVRAASGDLFAGLATLQIGGNSFISIILNSVTLTISANVPNFTLPQFQGAGVTVINLKTGQVSYYSANMPEEPAFLDQLLVCLVVGVASFTMYRRRVVQQSQIITTP